MAHDETSPSTDPAFSLARLCQYFSERSPHPMLAVEGATCIVRHVNAAYLALAGVRREDIVDRPFTMDIAPDPANGCGPLVHRVLSTGIPETLAEQKHSEDPLTYWSYHVWAILGHNHQPIGVMIQIADATEIATFRQRAVSANESLLLSSVRQQELAETFETLNAQLQNAIKEKEYFIAVLSHELRTPLTPILISTLMLQRDPRLDADTRSLMEMIHRNASLEARLIDDLLDLTRADRGKLSLDRRPLDLREPLRHAVEALASDLDAAAIHLVFEPNEEPQPIAGDLSRLEQVFSNLLRNAIKFTPPGGTITVRSWCEPDTCVAQITDTGAGIAPEFIPRAFVPFEQADKSHARKGGLGLGLTICKTILDLHGGVISASSDGPDRGSTFTVRLPTAANTLDNSPPVETDIAVRPLRILLVEDHADTARTMRRLLAAEGHTVEWAPDVSTGLRLSSEQQFDILLSDIGLPDGSGVDLMRALRKRGSLLPGIVLSGFGQEQDIARSRDAGFSAHLLKPLSLTKLHEAMASLVG